MPASSVSCRNCVNMISGLSQLSQLGSEDGLNYTMIKYEYLNSIKQGCTICFDLDRLACQYLNFCPANEAFRRPGSQEWDDQPRNPNHNSDYTPDPGSTADMNQILVINLFISTLDAEHYDAYQLQLTTWSATNRDNFSSFFMPNDPAARYVSTRPINRDVASTASYKLARSWIYECLYSHQACPSTTISTLPSRVIDVGAQDDSEDPRLYISEGQKSPYAALSYCWGGSQSMILTTSNVDSLTQRIDRSKLPQTVEDAIKSVRRLGLRFLWIDALCIMQDSPSDMDLEIVQMEQYYKNSHVTIAAASASTCSRGFLERRPEDDLPFSTIRYPCPDGATGYINILRITHYKPEYEPLNTRGWALQEFALSTRVLTYGSGQLYWWCHNGYKCDGGSVQYFPDTKSTQLVPTGTLDTVNDSESLAIVRSLLWKQWVTVVEEYSKRKLTVRIDKFPALSGIANRFATASSDTYCAGLWKTHLLEGLSWIVCDPRGRVEYEYVAPTWSWASSNGPVIIYLEEEEIIGKNSTRLVSEVLECVIVLENPIAPFGKIKYGSLTIRGAVKQIEWDGFFQIPMEGIDMSTLKLSTEIGSPLYPEGIIAVASPDYDEETLYVLNPSSSTSPGTVSEKKEENESWQHEITFYMAHDEPGRNSFTRPVTCLAIYNEFALMLEKCTNGNYIRLGLMRFQSSTKAHEYFHGCEEIAVTII